MPNVLKMKMSKFRLFCKIKPIFRLTERLVACQYSERVFESIVSVGQLEILSQGSAFSLTLIIVSQSYRGAQWLSGRVLDSRLTDRGFEPHWRHCVVSLSKNINPSLILVQPRKTRPYIIERLLMGRKESNQTKPE